MNKTVLLVGFDQRYRYDEAHEAIEKVLKANDIPVMAVSLAKAYSRSIQSKIEIANIGLLKGCDLVLLNQFASKSDCEIIGPAVLRNVPIKVFKFSKTLPPAEGVLGATVALEESTAADASGD